MKAIKCTNRLDTTCHIVTNDTGAKVYGVVGKIKDLMLDGVLKYSDYSGELWAMVPDKITRLTWFGKTLDEALTAVRKYEAQ